MFGQGLTRHNWFYGNSNQSLRFNRVSNEATLFNNQAVPFGNGASLVATNAYNGEVLFYTDGNNVYDITNNRMPEGLGLNGNISGNQTVVGSPVPGEFNKYYIFTNTASFQTGGTISYSVVDMNLFGNALFPTPPLGDLEPTKNIPVPGLTNASEAMMIIPSANQDSTYWLITHENNTSTFLVTRIEKSRAFTITPFTLGITARTIATFSYHAESERISAAPQSSGDNIVLLNFDASTGVLSLETEILNSGTNSDLESQVVYDTEFSPNGRFLYVSRHGDTNVPAQLLQFDLNSPTSSPINILPTSIFRSYGLEIAPDTAIYHLYQQIDNGPFLLGRINDADSIAALVIYEPALFNSTNFNAKSFPSFSPAQEIDFIVDFTFSGECANVPTNFYPQISPAADSLFWDFGDNIGASGAWSPVYTYETGNAYNVTLIAFLNGRSESITKTVNITQFDLQLTLPADTVACPCELPISTEPQKCAPFFSLDVQVQGGTPTSIVWSNEQTGVTLSPDSAGFYYVVVTDVTGCSTYASVTVVEYDVPDQRANIWYFGQNAGINFNEQPPIPLNNSAMNAPEGCAAISDRNGNIIFYTDGRNVYNKEHTLIADDLEGDPGASQSVVIVPVPGDETLYYIFTTMEVHGTNIYRLSYSLFDLKENNGLGDVVEKNVPLFTRSTERITGMANWLIAHEFGNNTFRAYPITPNGIGRPVLTSIGSDHLITSEFNGRGYMKLSNDFKLGVALSDPGNYNVVEVFDFDPTNGRLSNYRRLDTGEPNGQVYGIEFSPGGNKLYASLQGPPDKLFEFAFDSVGVGYLKQPVRDAPGGIGALQVGPDGQIYIAFNNSNTLGTIQAVEDTLQVSFVDFAAFALAGGTQSRLGLPNFIQNLGTPVQPPGINATGVCVGLPTLFTGTGTSSIDEFAWLIRNSANQQIFSSTDQVFEFTFDSPGNYFITLNVSNRCGLDTTFVETVSILNSPPAPLNHYYNDPNFTGFFLCDGPLLIQAYANDPAGFTYSWTNGATSKDVLFNQQSLFTVTATDANGCINSANGIVTDNRPPVELGPDFTVCQNDVVADLDAQQFPSTPVSWLLNGANPSTGNTRSVSTSTAGTFLYSVVVTDPLSGCVGRDSVRITINPQPVFTVTAFNTSGCGNPDGSIEIDITTAGTFSYLVVGPDTRSGFDLATPLGAPISEINLPAGGYTVIVTDQITGCSDGEAAGINDDGAFVIDALAVTPPICDDIPIDIQTTGLGTPASYRVIDVNSGAVIASGSGINTANFSTSAVPAGNYIVEITGGGCINTGTIAFVEDPEVDFNINFQGCGDPATAEVENLSIAQSDAGFAWTGPGILGSATTQSINLNVSGNYTVTVTDNTSAFCPATQTANILVDINAVNITQTDACAPNVTLRANTNNPGNFTYQWSRNGVSFTGGNQVFAGTDDNSASYTVTVRNVQSGCTFTSPVFVVEVIGEIELTLTSTIACDNGEPFTLTADTNLSNPSPVWTLNNNIIPGQSNLNLTETRPGTYRVSVEQGSCNAQASLVISLLPVTPSDLPNRAIICNDPDNTDPESSQVVLDPGPGFQQFNWFLNDNFISDNNIITVRDPGIYRAELFNVFGCPTINLIEIINDCQPKIVAPNAFRPGGLNSEFSIFSFFVTNEFQIFIYNRWGEMVFYSNERNFTWNGGYNNDVNRPLPGGQYAYVVRYVSVYRQDRGPQEKRGSVLLLR